MESATNQPERAEAILKAKSLSATKMKGKEVSLVYDKGKYHVFETGTRKDFSVMMEHLGVWYYGERLA